MKKVINCYVQMGYAAAKPMRNAHEHYWTGSMNLTFYENEFEGMFLQHSRDEYDKKAAKWINECAAPEYLRYADEAFTHEEKYCATLLQPETKPKLMKRMEKELISNRNQLIIEKPTGCKYMIENGRKDELKLLYKCFVREE